MYRKRVLAVVSTVVLVCAIHSAGADETARKKDVETSDTHNLRHSTGVVTDQSKDMLRIPDGYTGGGDFTVAKTPPVVDFAPIRGLIPEFFPEDNVGLWSQWGEVTKGPNGRFYMATGDHRCKDGHVIITEYDPVAKEQRIVVDVGKVCGWKPGEYVDGKIHGRMDILPDGTLVAATWLGRDVKQDDLDHGYVNGGRLITYNVNTGRTVYHGIPFVGDSWPYHSIDTQTGLMVAVGNDRCFMAYNVIEDKLQYGGRVPAGMVSNPRAMLLDECTGRAYSTDTEPDKVHSFEHDTSDHHFVEFNSATNAFRKLDCIVPLNPGTGLASNLRAYTTRRTPDNFFWCMDYQGTMFKFYPEQERTELVGVNWEKDGVYTSSMAMSSDCRFIYYVFSDHGHAHRWGTPVVQYNTETGERKVIAFLAPYYHKKYGYIAGGTFGLELSTDDSLLVIHMNGTFGPWSDRSAYNNCGIFAVHIPESER